MFLRREKDHTCPLEKDQNIKLQGEITTLLRFIQIIKSNIINHYLHRDSYARGTGTAAHGTGRDVMCDVRATGHTSQVHFQQKIQKPKTDRGIFRVWFTTLRYQIRRNFTVFL